MTAIQTETIMQVVILEVMNQGLTNKNDLIKFMQTDNFKLMFDTAKESLEL